MATEQQMNANRHNAQKSTGPTSSEGKARSSMNALKSGIDAESIIVRGEDSAEFDALTARYLEQLQPATDDERHQIDVLIRCDWLTRRYTRAETHLWNHGLDHAIRRHEPYPLADAFAASQNTLSRLDRRANANERSYNQARRELERLQSLRRAAETPAPPPQPLETESPAPELGSFRQTTHPQASATPTAGPSPETPKFGPQPASTPRQTPKEVPPKTA